MAKSPLQPLHIGEKPELGFEDLCALALTCTRATSVIITYLGESRAWSSTSIGLDPSIAAPFSDFASAAIRTGKGFVIADLQNDKMYQHHVRVTEAPFIRFCASFPLELPSGATIGCFCVFGPEPLELNAHELETLQRLTRAASRFLDLRHESQRQIESLERSIELTDAVLENLTDGVVACNSEGVRTHLNKNLREFFDEELVGADVHKTVGTVRLFEADGLLPMKPERLPLLRALQGEVLKDFDYVMENHHGDRRMVRASGRAMFGKNGRKLGAVITIENVTEAKRAAARLEASLKNMENLIEASSVAIFTATLDNNVTLWNQSCERLFGWSRAEILGNRIPYFKDEAQRISSRDVIHEVLRRRAAITLEATRLHRNGTPVHVQISVIPLFDGNDTATGYMVILSDISALKEREQKLAEANRLLQTATDERTEFIATMSHEIRTPLNGIIGMTELIQDTNLSEEQTGYFDGIQKSTEQLLGIVDDILAFSDIEAGKVVIQDTHFTPADILEEVEKKLRPSAVRKSLEIKMEIPELARQTFYGDRERIHQVLTHLTSNAIKFTRTGGVELIVVLTSSTGCDLQGREISHLRFIVRDTGVGVDDAVKGLLFRPFSQGDGSFSREHGGTGLGLSLSKSFVELMGGTMDFISQAGEGSTFWFEIPLPSSSIKASAA